MFVLVDLHSFMRLQRAELHPLFKRTQELVQQQRAAAQNVIEIGADNDTTPFAMSSNYGANCPEFPPISHVTQLGGKVERSNL
jgi:hypothetical protein